MTLEETGKKIGAAGAPPKLQAMPTSYKNFTFEGSTFPGDPYRAIVVTLNQWMITEYLPVVNAMSIPKGFKLLITAMAHIEGFKPGSRSYRTNNPGNIGNTDSGSNKAAATLAEGIQRQVSYIERIIAGKNPSFPMNKMKVIPPFYSAEIDKNPKAYGVSSGYVPGYRFKFTGQIDQFVKIYATFPRINNNYIDTIVSYFGQNGLAVTPSSKLQDIIALN